ncbi:hypothetical protein AC579_6851 [Pseudocercospora musae]|uniref:Uncharacterized protein n=1 Tax=Pseudocercospora musae TaxID=113226 RepID=A0A139I7N4_9PEZI|nr:hypothetical protein AC579_6851 [Pseudocercospora musae]
MDVEKLVLKTGCERILALYALFSTCRFGPNKRFSKLSMTAKTPAHTVRTFQVGQNYPPNWCHETTRQ